MEQTSLFPKKDKVYLLNEGQKEGHDWLVDFICHNGKDGFRKVLLNGYAGTGKTFLINRVVESVRKKMPQMNFGMTAPTHKAVRVLKRSSELRDMLDFGTIHSFLGLKQDIDIKDGKVSYKPDFNPNNERKIDRINVLIIDETSMLHDELFEYIEDEQRSNVYLLVIYMGDAAQIPPVGKKQETGEANAIPFLKARQQSHGIYQIDLTEPQRQAKESPIIMYGIAIREQANRQKIDFDFTEDMKEHLEKISPKGNLPLLRELFLRYYDTPEFQEDQDYVKVIAYTNENVNYFNNEIRLLLNKAVTLPRIIENEKLIMDKPLIEKKIIKLHTNDEVVTKSVTVRPATLEYKLYPSNPIELQNLLNKSGIDHYENKLELKVYDCILVDEDRKEFKVAILHEDSEKPFNALRDKIKQGALKASDKWQRATMWKQFYAIEEEFAWVKHNYAITAHKSQGSTYQYVFSMEWDMELKCQDIEERNRIRYVSATRAKEKLFVIK